MKELFLSLYHAENEKEASRIISSDPLMSNNANWKPYGGNINNFGIFHSQQSEPLAALVEKVTNSIDAILMKACLQRGIDPKSPSAPKTMEEAVELFFGIKSGSLEELTAEQKKEIVPKIQIFATGDKKSPNLMIYDDGEGQHPDDFERTFLSLQRGNKTDIHFVQGKFNMGSTGAVAFCGEYKYQLIASRRVDSLNDKSTNEIGWTLVRRRVLTAAEEKKYRNSWYEFFAPDGVIPRFDEVEIDLGLHERGFISGSIIKMFNYDFPRGLRTSLHGDFWRRMNMLLYKPALPILVLEKRDYKVTHETGMTIFGNKTRIALDKRSNKEVTVPLEIETAETGKIPIEVTVFKPHVDKNEYIGENAIVFTLNGQVQGSLPRKFISQDLKLQMLLNHMLISVDCTQMNRNFQQDLFMGSRDRLLKGEKTARLVALLKEELKDNEILRRIDQDRRSRLMHDSSKEQDVIEEFISKAPKNKELLDLIKKGGNFKLVTETAKRRYSGSKKAAEIDFSGLPYPTYFKVVEQKSLKKKSLTEKILSIFKTAEVEIDYKEIPLNSKGFVQFETDVENEFLTRTVDKGELQISIAKGPLGTSSNIEDIFDILKEGPHNGVVRIYLKAKSIHARPGDEFALSVRLLAPNSPYGDFEELVSIIITEPLPKPDGEDKKKDQVSMPQLVKIHQKADVEGEKTWEDYQWEAKDAVGNITQLTLNTDESGRDYLEAIAVNMDSGAFHEYLKKNRKKTMTEAGLEAAKKRYSVLTYFDSWSLFSKIEAALKEKKDISEIVIEDIVADIQKDHIPFLMSLVDSLAPSIEELSDDE